ncbi:MAG: FAD-dependent oxidoreductase [Rhodothermales bacterium]|nr:FAD-dependent oxidoreductase [Rhodothermales bacterium]MBO6780682.1 FAD-dependent oxidoreductase [Rhodothermales bacterium]
MSRSSHCIVVGAGVFGVTSALELRSRGHAVTLIDPGPLPHPLAASTDISKVVRMEYGPQEQYMAMVEQAIPGFERWNDELGEVLYHGDGVTMFTLHPMQPGGYEFESLRMLARRGHHAERLQGRAIQDRFPAWSENYVDGFSHDIGGYVESGRLIAALVAKARESGVVLLEDRATRVAGGSVSLASGRQLQSDHVVVCAGTWTHRLVPELAPYMRSTGHPVFHLRTDDPGPFSVPHFRTFMADVSRTGWYGFPYNPREGVIKVANHGVGKLVDPEHGERVVYESDHENLRTFLALAFPDLLDAEVVYTRRCLYCDTLDEHLWIDRHPEQPGLTVAAGGSGHGMKFAPVLGPLIADCVEGVANPWLDLFRWRHLEPDTPGEEAARRH